MEFGTLGQPIGSVEERIAIKLEGIAVELIVPLLITALTIAPEFRPYSGLMVLVMMLNSCRASTLGIITAVFNGRSFESTPLTK